MTFFILGSNSKLSIAELATVLGDDVFVGSDSQLIAPVTIADGATIGAGSTVTRDVAESELVISRAKERKIANWQRPAKIKK